MDLYIETADEIEKDRLGDHDVVRAAFDRALARISSLEAKLANQARARSELVHLVSHELRTPITVISGFGRLLQNEAHGALNADQAHFVAETLKACRRLDRFVLDLLEAAPETGTPLSVEIRPGDLHALLRAQLESLTPLLEEREIEVRLELAPSQPRASFDAHRIEQVINNLMMNAIRYGRPKGEILLETARRSDASGEWVEIVVEDDGPGIPVEDREHLFAPYVRGEGHETCAGLGIGLAICRRIIASHGGRIGVESGRRGGARFEFSLPCPDRSDRED